jgi:hypothetical protein
MTIESRQAKEAFYKGVEIGQKKMALWIICNELGIMYISGGFE